MTEKSPVERPVVTYLSMVSSSSNCVAGKLLGLRSIVENDSLFAESIVQDEATAQVMDLIQVLVIAEGRKQFVAAAERALAMIGNAPIAVHNHLVECGAPVVLTRCLARSLTTKERMEEVGPICQLMEVMLRCSKSVATRSLEAIVVELYPLLLAILLLDNVLSEWDTSIPATSLIERVSSFPIQLRRSPETDRLLRFLREAILISTSGTHKRGPLTGIFQLLIGLTLTDVSRRNLMGPTGFIDIIVQNFSSLQVISFHVATFLLVLAKDRTNKAKMVDTPGFIHVLLTLLVQEGIQTRKAAIAILKLVATEKAGRINLVSIGGTAFFDSLFDWTRKNEIQEEWFQSIRQLICPDTAKAIYSHENVINSMLKEKIFLAPSCHRTAIVAAKVINRLSSFLSVNGKGMERFLDAILQISSSKHHRIRYWGANALLKQSQVEACSFFLMRTQSVVQTIVNLSTDANAHVHSTAVAIVSNLTSFSLNQRLVARNQALLSSLAATVEDAGASYGEDAKREAVLAFLQLASNKSTKMIIAKQHNVVASLSKYGVFSRGDNKELKQAALHCVMWLTPFM